MTVRQKDVEKVYCPSPTPGTALVARLDGNDPDTFRTVYLDRVRGTVGDILAPIGVTTVTARTTRAGAPRHVVVVGGSIAGLLAAAGAGRPRGPGDRPGPRRPARASRQPAAASRRAGTRTACSTGDASCSRAGSPG